MDFTTKSNGTRPRTAARTLAGTMRIPFLPLTLSCVALGFAAAVWAGHAIAWPRAAIVLLGALAAHLSVNMLNEWSDFRSGLDLMTERTPFSGGSGALPADPGAARLVLAGGLAALGITVAVGLWLVATQGPALLPIGAAGLVLVLAYTPWITRNPLACLFAPGIGFGPLMTAGAAAAVAGAQVPAALAASLVPGALVSGLLLLNQFPDVDADRAVGRRHIPMLWGRRRAAVLFAALLGSAFLALLAAVSRGTLPVGALAGLLTLPLALSVATDAVKQADDLAALRGAMGRNVIVVLLTPLLMAGGGLWWSGL